MLIHDLADDPGENAYYEPEFLNMVESHFTHLRGLNKTSILPITDGDAYRFEGDFYGLLGFLNIPKQYHLIILTFNGLRHPSEYNSSHLSVTIPPFDEIDLLKAVYETKTTLT